ncbi:MAG: hypothetical protein JWP53_322, partial [Conexibacter sp.]|nr:hypothetical protein [Conexibacter sp.]
MAARSDTSDLTESQRWLARSEAVIPGA